MSDPLANLIRIKSTVPTYFCPGPKGTIYRDGQAMGVKEGQRVKDCILA
jgi:hypothetical protein